MSWTIRLRDQPEYASGSALLAGVDQWTAAEIKLSVDGSDVLNVTAPWSAEWLKTARPRHCLWVEDELGRVTEWRIIRIVDGRGVGAQETTVEAESLLSELSRVLLTKAQPGGATAFSFNVYDSTPAQLYDQFVAPALTAEGLTHFAKGTITPTTPLTFAFERFSALELLTEICNRTTTERWVERDTATSKYDIYVGTRGSAAPTVRTSFNRGNLQEYRRDRDSLTIATVSVPTGKKVDGGAEKSTLGFAAWKVTGATGTTLTLADPGGGDGPIAFADQLNSLYAVRPDTGALVAVTDSTATGQTVTLASGAGFAVGDHVQFVASSSGRLLTELTSPSGVATYGRVVGNVDDEELREERNWLPNPTLATWTTGGTPQGWTGTNVGRRSRANVGGMDHGAVQSSTATGGIATITASGLTPGRVIEKWDPVLISSVEGYITSGATVSTGGVATISAVGHNAGLGTFSPGATFAYGKPSSLGSFFADAVSLRAGFPLTTAQSVTSPSIYVRYIPGYATLWAAAGVTYYNPTASSRSYGTASISGAVSATATGFTLGATTWASGGSVAIYDQIIRGQATLTAGGTKSITVTPAILATGTYRAQGAFVRWVSITLGPDSQVPPIDGSHGNRIWQRGNQQLRLFGTPPTTYSVRLLDLVRARTPGLVDADDKLELGGAVKLIDDQLGEVDLRIVELRLDATNPYTSTVTLANIPPRLAKLAVRDKYAPPTRPDPTPPVQKPAAEEPTAPEITILAPSIGITTPEPITLVDGTWSIYG